MAKSDNYLFMILADDGLSIHGEDSVSLFEAASRIWFLARVKKPWEQTYLRVNRYPRGKHIDHGLFRRGDYNHTPKIGYI